MNDFDCLSEHGFLQICFQAAPISVPEVKVSRFAMSEAKFVRNTSSKLLLVE